MHNTMLSTKPQLPNNENQENLGKLGYLYSLAVAVILFTHTFAFHSYGLYAYFVYIFVLVLLSLVDFYTSNTTKHNFEVLQQHGFSLTYSSVCFTINIVAIFFPAFVAIHYLVPEHQTYHFNMNYLIPIVVNLAVTDIIFYFSHRYLHYHVSALHVMHHCCRRSSFSTTFLFHPFDLAIEFGSPVLVVIAMCILVWKDPFLLMLSLSALTSWYGTDHDEYLKPPHWYHHYKLNSNYAVYAPLKGEQDKEDAVPRLLAKLNKDKNS